MRPGLDWALAGLLAMTAGACTSPDGEELKDEDLKLDLPWDDVLSDQAPVPSAAAPGGPDTAASALPARRPAGAAEAAARRPALAFLAVSRSLSEPAAYQGGVYGTVGTAKVFVAPSVRIKDGHELYYVMVKVLSEKYSCFMSAKLNQGARTRVTCQDGRQVMFWRSQGPDWVGFHARQFDDQGHEVLVRHHKVVRIGSAQTARY